MTKEEQEKMFYVYHFVKMPEKEAEFTKDDRCHHESLRKTVKKQAYAISEIREKDPKTAQRILGIDGCNARLDVVRKCLRVHTDSYAIMCRLMHQGRKQ